MADSHPALHAAVPADDLRIAQDLALKVAEDVRGVLRRTLSLVKDEPATIASVTSMAAVEVVEAACRAILVSMPAMPRAAVIAAILSPMPALMNDLLEELDQELKAAIAIAAAEGAEPCFVIRL